jgi:nucleotide-binding universal stress UspA family protein
LNKKVIELAHSLAQREHGEAHYIYAWYLQSEIMLRGPRFKISDEEIMNLKNKIIQDGNSGLSKLFKAVHIQPNADQVYIMEGRTQTMIQKVIEEKSIDILVMGTVGRSGIPGLLIGNTAESLINDIQCSLMAVKPDGFVSPITL